MTDTQADMAGALRAQATACGMVGSPLYERLLTNAAGDVERGGVMSSLLEGFAGGSTFYGVPLKLLGAVHRLALDGSAPQLAALYPSTGGSLDLEKSWPAFKQAVTEHAERLPALIRRPVQTNEVGRSAALLGGFLTVARETGLPLRLLELGASAGLNLRWDRYLYVAEERRWGNPSSKVVHRFDAANAPPLNVDAVVGSRRGCDSQPLDPGSPEDRLTLMSYVWPDQSWRIGLLRAALDEAASAPVLVERADAGEWIENALSERVPGVATVVFHSLVLYWMDEQERARVEAALTAAGEQATKHSPLAWLQMEASGKQADVTLTTWPGGEQRLIARAGYHGRPTTWMADDQPAAKLSKAAGPRTKRRARGRTSKKRA